MNDLQGLDVLVAGSGAIGSVTALVLLRCGAKVRLADSAPLGDNASGVAAGMLAPVFECLLDPVSVDHFPLLAVARDAWPGLAETLPGGADMIDRSGALYIPEDDAELAWQADRLQAFDPAREILPPVKLQALSPGLETWGPGLFTALDWRLEPPQALRAIRQAFVKEGGQVSPEAVDLTGGHTADALVLATGAAPLPERLLERSLLTPIKGQILRLEGAWPHAGPVARAPGVYVAPSSAGALAGATMQEGLADRRIDPEAVARLRNAASRLYPALQRATVQAQAGVRAATPDGLPLAGPSRGDARTLLAVGARRNGWLLAPVVADVVAARLRGAPAGAFGEAFDPARFASR